MDGRWWAFEAAEATGPSCMPSAVSPPPRSSHTHFITLARGLVGRGDKAGGWTHLARLEVGLDNVKASATPPEEPFGLPTVMCIPGPTPAMHPFLVKFHDRNADAFFLRVSVCVYRL